MYYMSDLRAARISAYNILNIDFNRGQQVFFPCFTPKVKDTQPSSQALDAISAFAGSKKRFGKPTWLVNLFKTISKNPFRPKVCGPPLSSTILIAPCMCRLDVSKSPSEIWIQVVQLAVKYTSPETLKADAHFIQCQYHRLGYD